MAIAIDTVVKQLTDSGIIALGKLEHFIPPKAHPQSVEALTQELVKQNHLTKFQAHQVAAGKVKALILGGYTILDKIGAGGMGQVFKAVHRRMERTVAIKILPSAMVKDAAAVARFQREVVAAAKLNHSNIVTAFDADEAHGTHFLVMEYVEGKDLSALVKQNGPFPIDKAVNYILQAARGLEFAHSEGVVHRDIKPSNLLLDKKGMVKILDMGLARIEESADGAAQAELTGTGAIMGTVDFMAPEQALSTKNADARADIYSLGCSLYYLLAGKATYDGETLMGKMLAHREQPIPSLREAQPDVPEEVEAVFKKMVAKKIEERYQTMSEVVADLEKCSGHASSLSFQNAATVNLDTNPLAFLKNIEAADTLATQKTIKTAPAESHGGKNKKFLVGAVGASVLAVAILAGTIFSLKTKDGTLIVEVDQPDAMVQILDPDGKIEVRQKGGGTVTISVDPGKHRLKVEKDGFTIFGQEFEMQEGGSKTITAKLLPVKVAEVTSVEKPANQPTEPSNAPNFQQWMKDVAAMPAQEQVKAVSKKLVELNPRFNGVLTAGDGKSPPRIVNNVVNSIGLLTDEVTDISPVRALSGLTHLTCGSSGFGKGKLADISPLRGLPLLSVFLHATAVADLSPLESCKNLKNVSIKDTKATAVGVASLQAALPDCKIDWDNLTDRPGRERQAAEWLLKNRAEGWSLQILFQGKPVEISDVSQLPSEPFWLNVVGMRKTATDDNLVLIRECTGITTLFLNDAPVSNDGVAHLKGLKALINLTLAGTKVSDAGLASLADLSHIQSLSLVNTTIGDQGVAHLSKLTELKTLNLSFTKVTPTGIAALQKALPNCKIVWSDPAKATK